MHKFFKLKYGLAVALLAILFFSVGIYIGVSKESEIASKLDNLFSRDTVQAAEVDLAPFWKVWNAINEKYPNKEISDQEKIYGAISGLVESLGDPYSVFFEPEEKEIFEGDIKGKFGGIGVEIGMKNDMLTVIAPIKDTPAYRAGLKTGDKILKIDSTDTLNISIEKAISLIRGKPGTLVTLVISREGEKTSKEVKVVRDTITVPTLDTELRKDGIFVIKLYSFSEDSARLFRNAIKKFASSKSNKLLLDMRGNPGGYLESAVDMSSWFLEQGKIVVTEDYGNSQKPKTYRSRGYNLFGNNLRFVILIDGGSASATEILAGAMQDYKKALLVGEKSYGKGSVQEALKITPDTLLKITVAKWLTPLGKSISEKGLVPDYAVSITKEDLDKNKDPQMEKAVQLLKTWPGIK